MSGLEKRGNLSVSVRPSFVENLFIKKQGEVVKSVKLGKGKDIEGVFIWSYKLSIENKTKKSIQISDLEIYTVDEKGLVIKQDVVKFNKGIKIPSGVVLEHNGAVVLATSSGVMFGKIDTMQEKSKQAFISIPSTSLDSEESLKMPC